MSLVFVSIGSNIEREANIRRGVADLRAHYGMLRLSSVYDCPAVGFEGDDFYNLAAGFETDEGPHEVARHLREIERRSGRRRGGARFSARTLDIDLLLYDDQVIDDETLKLPRDEVLRYAFVLGPLAEIAGTARHPVLKLPFEELWARFDKAHQPLTRVDFDW